ncbi:hypothetical protein RCO48_18710 [Peribacillus frigoritolerans]|nr:hypothetical protein [Peribacillus frigoritolerans]
MSRISVLNLPEIIQKEMGAKSLELHNLSVLTDKDIEAGEDYFSLMEKKHQDTANCLAIDEKEADPFGSASFLYLGTLKSSFFILSAYLSWSFGS